MFTLPIILIAFLSSSLVEYCLHRFYLHNNYTNPHIQIHHKDFNGDTSYESINTNFKNIASSKKYIIVNIIIYSPIGIIILFENTMLGMHYFVFAILYTLWV